MQSELDSLIAERYELQSAVGSRGPLVIYHAVDRQLNRPVTVQVLKSRDAEAGRAFLRHQQIGSSIHHPGVLAVYDAGKWRRHPYSVILRASGVVPGDLYRPGSPPDLGRVLRLGRETAEALQYCRGAGLSDWTFSPEAVSISADDHACVGLLEGLDGPASSAGAGSDARAIAAVMRLMLSGRVDPSAAQLGAALVPGHVLGVLARLDNGSDAGPITAGDAASYLAEVEQAANRPTQAYNPQELRPEGVAARGERYREGGTVALHEAPTLAVLPPPARSTSAYEGSREEPRTETAPLTQADEGSARRWPPRLIPALAIVALLVLAGLVWSRLPGAGLQSDAQAAGRANSQWGAVRVPDLRGQSVDDARNAAGEAGLNLAVGEAAYDKSAPKDTVASQVPEALSQVSAGALVTVTLSLGPEPQPTPPAVAPAPQAPSRAPPGKGKKNGEDKGNGKDGR